MTEPDLPKGETREAPRNEGPGGYIGPFKILQQIGEGGFGVVFEAQQDRPVKRRVALKVIKHGMDTREVIARFEAERQALALMDHPHIARVLDAGATGSGRPYFVMELVKGEPISSYCDKHALSIGERLKLFEQVCAAVQHAHTKGVIHRDLKPSNVLVSGQDGAAFAKVIDFGIAKATSGRLTDKTLFTELHQMVGTPLYMSPEQAEGSTDIDTRTDIYSLGVLLYELLTGTTPFESDTLRTAPYAEVQRIIREVEPLRPSARLSASATTLSGVATARGMEPRKLTRLVRGELDWIVMKAIEKERARRYETVNGLAMDVHRYLAGQPVLAAPPSKIYRLRKFIRRNKIAVGAALLVAASLFIGIIGFAWQARIAQARATELEQVSKFQADMLGQVDPTAAGILLSKDVQAKFAEALRKADAAEADRNAQVDTFAKQWQHVNATDAARDLIDRTILKPAVQAIDQQFKDQPVVDAALRQVLADRYAGMGLYEAALPLQQRALESRRRVLGEQNPDTLKSINRLGNLLQDEGKLAEAEPYLREALEKRRRLLGEEHPDTLESINALGVLLAAQGKLDDAEKYYREALAKRRRVLGEEHPGTLEVIANLSALLQAQGKLSEAEPLLREALEKHRRVLGEEHKDTLDLISNMGMLLRAQGKLVEAEPYLRDALEKHRRVLGEEHPNTLGSINNMCVLLQSQGKLSEAEPFCREALEKYRRVLGADHPNTLACIGNLGYVLQSQGKLGEAEPLLHEALAANRRVLGDEHQNTLISTINMASLNVAEGKSAEAIALLMPAEAAIRKTFTGANAFRLAKFLVILGKARAGLSQYETAQANLLEANEILAQSAGSPPKYTLDCLQAIIDLYAAWNVADPGKGYDAKATEWKRKLDYLTATPA